MDRVLAAGLSWALRRGLRGEPLWLAVGLGMWLVVRGRRRGERVVWSGRMNSGERLSIRVLEPSRRTTTAPAEE